MLMQECVSIQNEEFLLGAGHRIQGLAVSFYKRGSTVQRHPNEFCVQIGAGDARESIYY
jgi:hypothetical protein